MFRFFALLALAAAAQAEPLRPFLDPASWDQLAGNERSFAFEGDSVVFTRAGAEPAEILTKADYENFDLTFEYNLGGHTSTGLFIHAPRNRAYRGGLEIELIDVGGGGIYGNGALYRVVPPLAEVRTDNDIWHTCAVHMNWPALRVTINGEVVQDIDLSAHEGTAHTLRRGALGFQHTGYPLKLRNLEVTPLPDTDTAFALFNGTDLTGWEVVRGNVDWQVRDGAIYAPGGDGYLLHEAVCEDFDLSLYTRTTPAANGGIFFRWPLDRGYDRPNRGHEIQILDGHGAPMITGSIYGYERGDDLALTPGAWSLLQVEVRGDRARTWLNGVPLSRAEGLRFVRPGHIVLQMHQVNTEIEFKDLRLRVVKP